MKLIANKSDQHKGKEYFKYLAVIPSKIVKVLGWKGGEELEAEVDGDKLIIKKKK